jgi:hypothetical protein
MRTTPSLVVVILAVAVSGCTTITRGTSESFAIETEPSGAAAVVTDERGQLNCTTPCSVKVKRRGVLHVEITKEGYRPVVTSVASSIDGAGAAGMAGNVILGGFIGAAVDAGSGAMHSHKPNPLHVVLEACTEPGCDRVRGADVGSATRQASTGGGGS